MGSVTKSQNEKLLPMMRKGWVDPLLALRRAECFRLAARVHELKQAGHNVVSRWQDDGVTRWKEYRIV